MFPDFREGRGIQRFRFESVAGTLSPGETHNPGESDMSGAIQCGGADLCEELSGVDGTSFALTYGGDPPSRLISQTPSIRILADLSPLVVGHLLVVPVAHYLSFSELVGEHGAEVAGLLGDFLPRYRRVFGPPTILEHGSSADMTTSACVTHAHWHVLPVSAVRIHELIVADGLPFRELVGFADLAAFAGRSYFYCSDGKFHRVYGIGGRMRSQYLRSLAGQVLGIPDPLWDYSLVVRRDYLRGTMLRAHHLFDRLAQL